MNKGAMIGIGVAIAIGLGSIGAGVSLLNTRNVAVGLEESIQAQLVANKSNYDGMVKSAKEMVQVTDKYADDFERIYKGLVDGRYSGEEGQKQLDTLFKVVHESNPNLDPTVYTTLQRELSANRKTFDNKQAMISDKIREYNTYIKKHFIMASVTNRDTMDANKYIVTSNDTQNAFDSGVADEINLKGE